MLHPSLRRTGRTERMLRDVAEAMREGRYCFVVCGTKISRNDLQHRFARMVFGKCAGTKVYPGSGSGQVSFECPGVDGFRFDWSTGRAPGAHEACLYFMDHHTAEAKFRWVLKEWLRYSIPSVVNPFEEAGR